MSAFERKIGPYEGLRVLVLSPTPTSPANFGNRRRIRQICADVKAMGGEIIFVHYASELEWRQHIPPAAQSEMSEMWDEYHLIPPSINLHAEPLNSHHGIDDWWDPTIEAFLRWYFKVSRVDIFIVNYTWLSYALTLAPRGVLRILDTHDRFSGRKELLSANGIAPEFFYLASDEVEKQALCRADVVWAIKPEEARIFEQLVTIPVIVMPYMEALSRVKRPAPDPDGYLRVGVIGGSNNINRINIMGFIDKLGAAVRERFAPIRLHLAGSVCNDILIPDNYFLKKIGLLNDVKDFYREIDVACVPMEFSTGLKIKSGEALCFGVPVISTEHAFEGYPPHHPFQALANIDSVVDALVELSFNRKFLPNIELAALESAIESRDSVLSALNATAKEIINIPRALLIIEAESLRDDCISAHATISLVERLNFQCVVEVFICSGKLYYSDALRNMVTNNVNIKISSDVSVDADSMNQILENTKRSPLREIFSNKTPKIIFIEGKLDFNDIEEIENLSALVVVRAPILCSVVGNDRAFPLIQKIKPDIITTFFDRDVLRKLATDSGSEIIICPNYQKEINSHGAPSRNWPDADVFLIFNEKEENLAMMLKLTLECAGRKVLMISGGENLSSSVGADLDEAFEFAHASWVASEIARGAKLPSCAVDISALPTDGDLLCESLIRKGVPVLRPRSIDVGNTCEGQGEVLSPIGLSGMLLAVADIVAKKIRTPTSEFEGDGSWNALWRIIEREIGSSDRIAD